MFGTAGTIGIGTNNTDPIGAHFLFNIQKILQ